MKSKKLIKKEIKFIHLLILATAKLMIGISIGIIIASYGWFSYPNLYMLMFIGFVMVVPLLIHLMREEVDEELRLDYKLKKGQVKKGKK